MEQTTENPTPRGINGNGAAAASHGAAPAEARAPASEVHGPPAAAGAPKPRSGRVPLIILGIVVFGGIGAYVGHAVLTAGEEDTDDAQVEADVVPLAARTGGLVSHVHVHDNQAIHAGDVLLEIDPTENEAHVAQARAELATQEAQAAAADAEVELVGATARGGLTSAQAGVSGAIDAVRSAGAAIASAEAGVTRARAQAAQTTTNLNRVRALRSEGAVAQAELDNAQAADDAAQAAVAQSEAQLAVARAQAATARTAIGQAQGHLEQSAPVETQLARARAQATLAHARVESARAVLHLAEIQLSYTRVTAPSDGVVSRLNVHEGQLIQPGQAIAELVPSATYVVANFKETQVGRMRPGNRVEIRIDAFPGRVFEGQVESISGGTGARFSLLPPDNASGNFVKVVQRIPVRVRWNHPPGDVALRAGMSCDVTVHVR